MVNAKVSEKSTKTDIWTAYQQLLSELDGKPVTASDDPAKLQQMAATLSEAKTALVERFDATLERLNNAQQVYAATDQELAKRKAQVIEELQTGKHELENTIAETRKQHLREEEEYNYNLNLKRRDEEAAYKAKTVDREAILKTREVAVIEQEKLQQVIEQQVKAFPAQLEAAVKEAQELLAKDLKAQHEAQIKEQSSNFEHQKSLLELRLQTAENIINTQAKQLIEVQKQFDGANSQLKEMAVVVIQSKSVAPQPSSQPQTQS